jgi:hypothetical protein
VGPTASLGVQVKKKFQTSGKAKCSRGRPRSRWNIRLGNMSHWRTDEYGKKLRMRNLREMEKLGYLLTHLN